MILLIKLLLAHFIGDFLLQPKSWVEEKQCKKIKSPKLYFHTLIHALLVLLLLWDLNLWLLALLVFLTHAAIDIIKVYAQKEENKTTWFLIDQLLHLVSIVIIWTVFFQPNFNLNVFLRNENFWIYLTALVFLSFVAGIGIQVLMLTWSKSLDDNNNASLNNAGKYIGILERLFVFTFIVTGNWQAIGFLLAAKSIFRFGDLKESKERKLTEYILIGTLLSFAIAVATGMLISELTQ